MPNSTFTPEQIQEILNIYFENFAHRQYIGQRYVPIFGRKDEESIQWDNTGTYEPLTIVLYQGNSYTSRQFVPIGVEITNQTYWAETGNYNAQVESYKQIVEEVAETLEIVKDDIDNLTAKELENAISSVQTIETAVPIYREINLDTYNGYDDMQGGVVFKQNGLNYYSFITGNDEARKLKTIRIDNMSVLSEIEIPAGHYGTIGYQDEKLIVGNYTSTVDNYGKIFVYDVSIPTTVLLYDTYEFDTNVGAVGITSYKDNMFLIEGNPANELTDYKGIYTFNIETNRINHLFDIPLKENGERSQPGAYDPILDCFVTTTTDNTSLTYYKIDGSYLTCIHLKDIYNFISLGELENITPRGKTIYFGGFNITKLRDATSITLFKFDVFENKGKSEYVQNAFQKIHYIDFDVNNGLLIPNFISGEATKVKFPEDGVNIAHEMQKMGTRQIEFRGYGNFDCGLYISNLNCVINLLNGYFAQGIQIVNSTIDFVENRAASYENANTNYEKINSSNNSDWFSNPAIDKPAYLALFNCNVVFQSYAFGTSDTNSNIYGVRLTGCKAVFSGTASIRNIAMQNSDVKMSTKTLGYFFANKCTIKAFAFDTTAINITETNLIGRVQNNLNPNVSVDFGSSLPLGEIFLTILDSSGGCLYSAKRTISTATNTIKFIFNNTDFIVSLDNTTGIITTPSNSNYQYILSFI